MMPIRPLSLISIGIVNSRGAILLYLRNLFKVLYTSGKSALFYHRIFRTTLCGAQKEMDEQDVREIKLKVKCLNAKLRLPVGNERHRGSRFQKSRSSPPTPIEKNCGT